MLFFVFEDMLELIEVLFIGMQLLELVHGLGNVFPLTNQVLVLGFYHVLGLSLVVPTHLHYLGLLLHELFPLLHLKG